MQASTLSGRTIRPTCWALFLATMTLAILLVSMNYGLSLGYFFSFLLLSMIAASAVTAWFNLGNIEWMATIPAPVFLGQTIALHVNLVNNSTNNKYGIALETALAETIFTDMDATSQKRVCLTLLPDHRGWWSVPPLTLHSTFPLGLFSVTTPLCMPSPVLIYPTPATTDARASEKCTHALAMQEDTHAFNGHRSYVTGDSLRHIDWKAYSRHQKLLLKTYTPEHSSAFWLDWQSTTAQDDEEKIAILTRNVIHASQLQSPYGLRLPNGLIPPGQGWLHQQQCLKMLALL